MPANKYRGIMLILLFTALFAVIIAVWALFFKDDIQIILPDRVPAVEDNAEKIPGDESVKSEAPEGGGFMNITYSNYAVIDLDKKKVELYFANPNKSTHDAVMQLVVKDKVIVQSGTISPGNQVRELELVDGADKMLAEGGYDGKFVLHFYDRVNGEIDDSLNMEILANIEVK